MPSTTAALLISLEAIEHETRTMLSALDADDSVSSPESLREVKRRVLEIRTGAQQLMDWLGEIRLEDHAN